MQFCGEFLDCFVALLLAMTRIRHLRAQRNPFEACLLCRSGLGDSGPNPPAVIVEDRARGIVSWRSRNPAPGMRPRAAVVKARNWSTVIGITEGRARPEQLIERERAMENVAANQPEYLLQVQGAEDLPVDDAALEPRRVAVDGVDHQIGNRLAAVVP